MKFVVSKLAAGVHYTLYEKVAGGKKVAVGSIAVKGGAGVTDKRTLITPQGVVTAISDTEAAQLKVDPVFKIHEKHGAVKILAMDPRDADRAASDLDADKSAQLTADAYKRAGKTPPTTGKVEE